MEDRFAFKLFASRYTFNIPVQSKCIAIGDNNRGEKIVCPRTKTLKNACQLTVQSDGSLGLAQRVFANAPVATKVIRCQVPDGESHVRPIAVLHDISGVFLIGENHLIS